MSYNCVPKTGLYGRLLQICEGSSHVIHCYGSKRIRIISADYGRVTGEHVCGKGVRTTNCGAAGALSKVRRNCQGRSSCVLRAGNTVFGDSLLWYKEIPGGKMTGLPNFVK